MVWRQEKILRTNLQPNPSFRASAGYTTVRTNLVSGGFSTDTNADGVADGWVAYNSGTSSAISYSVVSGAQRIKAALGTGQTSRCGVRADVPPGYVYAGMPVQVKLDMWGTFTTGQNVRVYVDWRNASGTLTGTTQFATAVSTIGSSSKSFSATLPAIPSGTTAGAVCVWVEGGTTAGDFDLYVDNLIVETASTLGNFFDGSSANGSFDSNLESVWTGTANASPSVARGLLPADWTPASSWKTWIAEDGKSAYVRYLGATSVPGGTLALYSTLGQTVPTKATVSTSIKVLSANAAFVRIQGYGGSGEGGSYGLQSANGGASIATYTLTNPDVTNVRMWVCVPATSAGTTYQLTQALLEVSPAVGMYFDGSYASITSGISYRWAGTVDRAQSHMYLPAILTPTPNSWDSWDSWGAGFAESWFVDGIDIQAYAFGIEKFDSIPPEMRGAHTTLPNVSGVIPRFNRAYDPGSVTLKMWILGCDTDGAIPSVYSDRRQLFERNMRMLHRLFGYQGNTIELRRIYIGDYVGATPTAVTARAIISGFSGLETMMARQRAELTVELTLIDAFWSDVTPTTDASSASATLPKTVNLSDAGTAPIDDAVMTIVGPIVAPKVTCPSSGSWVQYTGTVAANQTLVIDSGKGTATLNGVSVLSNILHGGSARLMVIPPREGGMVGNMSFQTSMTLSGTGGGASTALSVKYNRKHLVMV